MNWYEVENISEVDSPALLIYPDRIRHNIRTMIAQVGGNPKRLFPHVKTHKMPEVVQMQMDAGIDRFKCATIAEMEMCLEAGAKTLLLAYQLTGPKIKRFIQLAKNYPEADLSSLVDNITSARELAAACKTADLKGSIYLDVDNGMHRTGFPLGAETFGLVRDIADLEELTFKGLHVYDGQFRERDVNRRRSESDKAFEPVYSLVSRIEKLLGRPVEIINGGSPSFSPAALREDVFCSPGTVLLWDAGYAGIVPELDLQWAAVLLTRIISKPSPGIVTVDLGHKAVGSENPMDKRVYFLNLEGYTAYKHSEEHLMLKVVDWDALSVGDVLYGIPHHVCPSVALHDEACVIVNNRWTDIWKVVARKRKITV